MTILQFKNSKKYSSTFLVIPQLSTMKVILIFLVTSKLFISVNSIDLTCTFKAYQPWNITYGCDSGNIEIISKENRDLILTSNTHAKDHANKDVQGLNIENKICHFFPKKVNEIFPNAETFRIYNSGLKEVTKDDLKQFGEKLKNLWIDLNEIEKLDADLFVNNPKLISLVVKDNLISIVEDETFKNLPDLAYIDFINNPCYSSLVYGQSNALKAGKVIEKRCKDFKLQMFEIFDKKIIELKIEMKEKCGCKFEK